MTQMVADEQVRCAAIGRRTNAWPSGRRAQQQPSWFNEPYESLTWLVSNLVSMYQSATLNAAYIQRLTLTSVYGMISDLPETVWIGVIPRSCLELRGAMSVNFFRKKRTDTNCATGILPVGLLGTSVGPVLDKV